MAGSPVWASVLRNDPLPWLLEEDASCPGVRWFALTQLLEADPGSKEAVAARKAIMMSGPVPEILSRQQPNGAWSKLPYGEKYVGTVWSLISLWQTGADQADVRVRAACDYVLGHSLSPAGVFTYNGSASGFIHCLSGNTVAALFALGAGEDERVTWAVERTTRMITGDGVLPKGSLRSPLPRRQRGDPTSPLPPGEGQGEGKVQPTSAATQPYSELRYYSAGTPGPGFQCVANGGLPCGWGAAKELLALAAWPVKQRTPEVRKALDQTTEFLLSRNPCAADYPTATTPSSSWQKFGFPVFYVTDYLTVLEGLALAGKIKDPRAGHAVEAMLAKQDAEGRWKREYAPRNPVGFDPGAVGQPNKWVTVRALRVLKAAAE